MVLMDKLATFDTEALYVAVDAERRRRRVGWQVVAAECGMARSAFTRLGRGEGKLNLDNVACLAVWAGLDLNRFVTLCRPEAADSSFTG